MPGVPAPMKVALAPIEVLGMFTKPFSLMIRLFANITAGHAVVMGLIAVAYTSREALGMVGGFGGVLTVMTDAQAEYIIHLKMAHSNQKLINIKPCLVR
jgi:F-type H+-transporting ATPase subunit a